MESANLQFISILVSAVALLGWIIQTIIKYFIKAANDNALYFEKLVAQNQENVTNFINTINHQRTLDREMQVKNTEAITRLTIEITTQNNVTKELIRFLRSNGKQPE